MGGFDKTTMKPTQALRGEECKPWALYIPY